MVHYMVHATVLLSRIVVSCPCQSLLTIRIALCEFLSIGNFQHSRKRKTMNYPPRSILGIAQSVEKINFSSETNECMLTAYDRYGMVDSSGTASRAAAKRFPLHH
jgi:hypothetical protein